MARPRKNDIPDTTRPMELTAGAIARLTCRSDVKTQAFLRDIKAPGLRVRVTNTGHKSFVFEAKLHRRTVRRTIGDVRSWTIEQAREEARRLAVLIDEGTNPNEQARQEQAAADVRALLVRDIWAEYVAERRPHWSAWHIADHEKVVRAGGTPARRGTRGTGSTRPGPLEPFMGLHLGDITPERVQTWAEKEAKLRPTQARLALRLLRAFLNWCEREPRYATGTGNPAEGRRLREALGKPRAKHDALQREQLAAWFAAVGALPAVTAAYLQALLLTGARPSELRTLRWDDVDMQWHGLTIRDKAASKGGNDGTRTIPLPPYVAHLLAALPRRGPFVFAGAADDRPMSPPHHQLTRACNVAGIEGLTLHGLRRSFGTLSEWLEMPAGVVAQIMGHKPSAIAEKHYRVRPLDLLRVHHERLEAWILKQAGVPFDADEEPGKLRVVAGN